MKKFISLFTKTPQYQRFNYAPRYYDPKKEEMMERENRIRRELELERGERTEENATDYRRRMVGSFHAARRRSKMSGDKSAVLLRLGILLFISGFLIAFLTWGKPVIYSLFLFIPFYFYLKFKQNNPAK